MIRFAFLPAAVLWFAPLPTAAQTQSDYMELCREISNLAESIMSNRQSGASMVQMMDIADGNGLAQSLVAAAYEEPRYSTPQYQQEAISDFRDQAYLECYRAVSD